MNQHDAHVRELTTILAAYASETVLEALKLRGRVRREKEAGEENPWMDWHGEELPPKPFEWRKLGGRVQYREPQPPESLPGKSETVRSSAGRQPEVKMCPDCGADAFAQAVCPACTKGRAGIRKMFVCGENSEHVFFTE